MGATLTAAAASPALPPLRAAAIAEASCRNCRIFQHDTEQPAGHVLGFVIPSFGWNMMYRMYVRAAQILPLLLGLTFVGEAAAAPPAPEQIFPAGTTEFVAIPDVNRMTAAWQQTQFSQMIHDPALQPFLNDLFDR